MSPQYKIIHRGLSYQRGTGLGNIFRSLLNIITPLFKSGAKIALKSGKKLATSKTAQSALKSLKKDIKKGGVNVLANILEGKNVKQGVKQDISKSRENLAKTIKQGNKIIPRKRSYASKIVKKGKRYKKSIENSSDPW